MDCKEMLDSIKHGNSSMFSGLIDEYEGFINQITDTTYIEGYERDDLLQVSYIAIFLAAGNYQPEKVNDCRIYIEQAVKNSFLYEIEKRKRQGCTISLDNLSKEDYKLISSNSYSNYINDNNVDERDKKKFLQYVFTYGI